MPCSQLDSGFKANINTQAVRAININQNNGEITIIYKAAAGAKLGADSILMILTYNNGTPLSGDSLASIIPYKLLTRSCIGGTLAYEYRPAICRFY